MNTVKYDGQSYSPKLQNINVVTRYGFPIGNNFVGFAEASLSKPKATNSHTKTFSPSYITTTTKETEESESTTGNGLTPPYTTPIEETETSDKDTTLTDISNNEATNTENDNAISSSIDESSSDSSDVEPIDAGLGYGNEIGEHSIEPDGPEPKTSPDINGHDNSFFPVAPSNDDTRDYDVLDPSEPIRSPLDGYVIDPDSEKSPDVTPTLEPTETVEINNSDMVSHRLTLPLNVGLFVGVGYLATERIMPYIKVGFNYYKINLNSTIRTSKWNDGYGGYVDETNHISTNKWLLAPAVSIGSRFAISQHLEAAIDYQANWGSSNGFKINSHTVSATLSYRF